MEARVRFLAAWAAAALFLGILLWAFGVLVVVDMHFNEYCEDFDICYDGEPVPTVIQAIVGFIGIAAAIWLAIRLVSYARGKGPPGRLTHPGLVAVGGLVTWLVVVEALL